MPPIKITPFSTTPLKINYSLNKNQDNKNEINNETQINNQNDNLILQKKPSSYLFKKIRDISIDWELMQPVEEFIIQFIKGWTITIDEIDERFIKNIETTILYRTEGAFNVLQITSKNSYIEIIDVVDSDTLKNIIIHAGLRLFVLYDSISPVLYAKILVKLKDPLTFN